MKEKEKAKELVNNFRRFVDKSRVDPLDNQPEINAKQCAMIAVDELIVNSQYCSEAYWIKVKSEIEAL
jgi:hypothetical protein